MPELLRIDNKLVGVDGKRARRACREQCCNDATPEFFYAARRCDLFSPPPVPLPIPDSVPKIILIPGPWGCPGEPCEIAGRRIVLFGGHCYVVDEELPEKFQEPPCAAHLKPRRYQPRHFDPQPPIVDHSQLTCKPLGETCDIDCIPQAPPGSCCTPTNCTSPPQDWPVECFPCDCPRFHRYAIVFQWSASRTHRVDFDCAQTFTSQSSGYGSITYDCDTLDTPSVAGLMVRSCTSDSVYCGTQRCAEFGETYTGPHRFVPGVMGFGDNPIELIASEFPRDLFCTGFCGGWKFPIPTVVPCSGDETDGGFPNAILANTAWSTVVNCYGGQYTGSFRTVSVATGCVVCQGEATVVWAWVPLIRCDSDPNPILDVPPTIAARARKELRRSARSNKLSVRDTIRLILGGA